MNLEDMSYEEINLDGDLSVPDQWILTRLNETIKHVTQNTDKYEFGEAGRYLYNFIWDDFCDWYIEMSKLPLYGEDEQKKQTTRSVLAHVLDQTLRMLHPYMPFITEEIWQQLPHQGASITVAKWPEVQDTFDNPLAVTQMDKVMAVIKAVRNIRAEVDTPMSRQVVMMIQTKSDEITAELEANRLYLERFCNTSSLTIGQAIDVPEEAMSAVITGAELYLPLEGLIDFEKEISRLEKELVKWQKEVTIVQKKLSNDGFVNKAPEKVVAAEREKELEYVEKRDMVEKRLAELKK